MNRVGEGLAEAGDLDGSCSYSSCRFVVKHGSPVWRISSMSSEGQRQRDSARCCGCDVVQESILHQDLPVSGRTALFRRLLNLNNAYLTLTHGSVVEFGLSRALPGRCESARDSKESKSGELVKQVRGRSRLVENKTDGSPSNTVRRGVK